MLDLLLLIACLILTLAIGAALLWIYDRVVEGIARARDAQRAERTDETVS